MDNAILLPAPRPRLSRSTRIFLIAALFVVIVAAVFLVVRLTRQEVTTGMYGVQVPVSRELEEKYGVRVVFAGLTARDGMVDLRYRIVDAGKAKNFGHYTETSPLLITENGEVVDITKMGLHNHRVEPGLVFHVLYRNTENRVTHGERVTVQVGDIQLRNIVVH